MNIYLLVVLGVVIFNYLIELLSEGCNLKNISPRLDNEFAGYYDADKYRKSQDYLRETTKFALLKQGLFSALIIGFILLGGFNFADKFARGFGVGPIITGLILAVSLMLAMQLLQIPFAAYRTFVLEERFGFNRTDVKTFILDSLKGLVISAVLAGGLFALLLWIFQTAKEAAWIYCWLAVSLFQLFLVFISPLFILPLFNKFIPLKQGALEKAIREYATSQRFGVGDIFKIDASRRSSKSNAYFSGFGKSRRIALFDTLIAKHTLEELVSILAHEVGHYKKRHILKIMAVSVLSTGVMFYLLPFFIAEPGLFAAFKMEQISVYAGFFFFALLYTPINLLFSVFKNYLSRRYEYAADRYAVSSYGKPEAFISALKKLTVDNLSNLKPHPLKVFLDYSHPPVLQRIKAIRGLLSASPN